MANLLSFVGVFLAAGAYYLFASGFHQTAAAIFLDGAILTLATTSFSIYLLPDSLVRLALWMATHSIYRLHVEGRDHVPERGGALLVSNNLSVVDALLLLASSERAIRFLISREIYDRPLIKPVANILGAIPFSRESAGEGFVHALESARRELCAGELVCISREGQVTGCTQLASFRGGIQQVIKSVNAPIISVSVVRSSRSNIAARREMKKKRFPEPVIVSFGAPLAASSWALEVQEPVQT